MKDWIATGRSDPKDGFPSSLVGARFAATRFRLGFRLGHVSFLRVRVAGVNARECTRAREDCQGDSV